MDRWIQNIQVAFKVEHKVFWGPLGHCIKRCGIMYIKFWFYRLLASLGYCFWAFISLLLFCFTKMEGIQLEVCSSFTRIWRPEVGDLNRNIANIAD
jgi:hypothetical protein